MPGPLPRPPLDRYREKVDRSSRRGCWPWTGGTTDDGYGYFWDGKRMVLAHRFGFENIIGPIPQGHGVLHTCDNPPCQRPDHWFTGTQADNLADMVAKGRRVIGDHRGEANGRAKLTRAQADTIRKLYAAGDVTQRELGERFGVSQFQVSTIVRHKQWV